MKKFIKKAAVVAFEILAASCFIFMMAGAETPGMQIIWTLGCVGGLLLSCKCLDALGALGEEEEA